MTLEQQLVKLRTWLQLCTLKNTWTMRHDAGRTVVHVFRRQHFIAVARKALDAGFPISVDERQIFSLHWPDCSSCRQPGTAHDKSAPFKCLFGSTYYVSVDLPRLD